MLVCANFSDDRLNTIVQVLLHPQRCGACGW
jgi:hypothetical protein